MSKSTEQYFENFVSNLLRIGVILATSVVMVGGILYLIRHGESVANYQFFRGEPSEFRSPAGVVKAVSLGRYRGIIQFGLLLLIATPVARVTLSLMAFVRQRDLTYVIVTLIVISGLIYSLIAG